MAVDKNDPEYKDARRKVYSWVSLMRTAAMMTRTEKDDRAAELVEKIINDNFDEAWEILNPQKASK